MRFRNGLAFQNDLVFFGRVNLPAKKHETMERQTQAPPGLGRLLKIGL
jgi:hypothetical protein